MGELGRVTFAADAMGANPPLMFRGVSVFRAPARPACCLLGLNQLPGSLDIVITPKPCLHFAQYLNPWRFNPVAICDVPLKRHKANAQPLGSFA
jgi:hypothetical protein